MDQEKKHRRTSWIVSIGVQLVMLVLFYFLIAWKEPFPPLPTYGIELNFGFETTGSGIEPVSRQQTEQEEVTEETEPAEEPAEEVMEEASVESLPVEQPSEVNETAYEDNNSPDVVEKVDTKSTAEPIEETKPKIVEEKPKVTPKPKVEEKPEINQEALFPGSTNDTQNASQSQGTTDNATGDQGKEEGTIDGRSLYGSQGAADGASLQMAGWTWDFKPEPNDKSSESGKIVYKIIIDDEGYLSRIDLVSSTVSPEVERLYRQSIERLSFSKTNDYKPAPTSTGLVTFIIRTR